MAEKIRTRIRLNSKEPELMPVHLYLQKKQKIKDANPLNSTGGQILRMHTMLGNEAVQQAIASGTLRARLKIGQPNDKYEQEADRAADQVMRMPRAVNINKGDRRNTPGSAGPTVQTQAIPEGEAEPPPAAEEKEPGEKKEEEIQTKPLIQRRKQKEGEQGDAPSTPGQLESELAAQKGGGAPLPVETRLNMETRFGADFSGVRVHDDATAHRMNRDLQAQAFTHQNHIYFGSGYFDPHSYDGQLLLAHELAHVLQQGAAVHRKIAVTTMAQASPQVIQRQGGSWDSLSGILSDIAGVISGGIAAGKRFFRDFLRRIPGYSLLGVVMGRDPLTGEGIARNGRNFIEAGLDVIPFGGDFKRKLEQEGALDEAAAWLDGQITQLDFNPTEIAEKFREFWDKLGLKDVLRPGDVIQRLRNIFEPPIARLFRFAVNVAEKLLEIVKKYLISKLIEFIRNQTRAYPLLTVILGHDPISQEKVERTPMNLIRGFMELSEEGAEQLKQMEETGTLQRAADWVSSSVARLKSNLQNIRDGFTRIWQSVSIGSLMDPVGTFREIYNTFAGPVGDILSFLLEVAVMVLKFIKDALLHRLSAYARKVRGYHLLTVILGRDPFTGEDVPRTAVNFIRGFLSFLEDGEERFRNLQESGAIDKAFAWLDNEVKQLNLSWADITALFRTAWDSFSLRDLADPVGAFRRIVDLFKEPVGRIIRFAGAVGMKILEFVFEGVMGAGGARVLSIIKKGRATFLTIVKDPIAFLGHLIDAAKLGFRQFGRNILQHLQAGLVGWLFGALEGAGLQMPQQFDLKGIISLVLQILGLTYDRIRPRLVRLMGERVVSMLESTFEFLRLLVTEGPAAAWQKIVEFAGNLRDQVMEGIKNFVVNRIVQAAVTKLATMFNPVGAVIQAIITIYNTVMFFIERINQILALVESIIDSIANIAAGNIAPAANYVEQTMARTLPVIISFLARLMGLGNISESIRGIIKGIQGAVDKAIDRVADWIAAQARRLRSGGTRGDRETSPESAEATGDVPPEQLKLINSFNEPFTMDGAEHHLYARYANGTIQVEMATDFRQKLVDKIDYALTVELNVAGRKTGQWPDIKKGILEKRAELVELESTINHWKNEKNIANLEATFDRIRKIAKKLKHLGDTHDIKSFQSLGHPSKYVGIDNKLNYSHPSFKRKTGGDAIRPFLYGGWKSPATGWRARKLKTNYGTGDGVKDPTNPSNFISEDSSQEPSVYTRVTISGQSVATVPRTEVSIDHIRDVGNHWNNEGNNCRQSQRETWYNNTGINNLRLISKRLNSSKSGDKYEPDVKKNFLGPDEP